MKISPRARLAWILSLLFGLAAMVVGGDSSQARDRVSDWPQQNSDLGADPQIRFGQLPNGLRYALMRNATPTGQASFRLRFAVGSLMESDTQQGLAHFLEHMAFKGSRHVPTGQMIPILERHGLAFGADTNASTDWSETVYKLDLPKTDDDTVDTSLMLLREIAGDLLIDQDAMNSERGVVLSEERLSDTPGYRAFRARLQFFLPDQKASQRLPIGKIDVVQSAPRAAIADLYDKYYRPERAVFVAVGDFDVDVIEAKVRARFGDWRNAKPAGVDPDLGVPAPRDGRTRLTIEPGAPLSIQIGWVALPDRSPDTSDKRRRALIERLGLSVLNRRLERLARGEGAPFLGAAAYRGDEFHSAKVATLQISAQPSAWQAALSAAVAEQRRLTRYGVLPSELQREIAEMRAGLKEQAAQAATRRTPLLANDLVDSVDEDEVLLSPAQQLDLFEKVVSDLTPSQVSAALRQAFLGEGPLVFMSTPQPIEGGQDALAFAFKQAWAAPVAAPTVAAEKAWPYGSFGPPGAVVLRREAANVGATLVRFANGVRLSVKPTAFRKDQVLVQLRLGDGRRGLPKDHVNAAWARGAFIEGGLKTLTAEDLDQIMTSKIVGSSFRLDDDAFVLQGATRPADLATQVQLLTAYVADPGFRPEAFARMRTYGLTLHDQLEATANGVVNRDLSALLHSGDRRWGFPSREAIAASRPEDLKSMLSESLAKGPIEVIIVGDVTVEQAIAVTAATAGALPPRDPPPRAEADSSTAFPAPAQPPLIERHKGRADQAMAVAAWPTTDFFADPRQARAVRAMAEVMRLRLIQDLRVAQGATYSPGVSLESSLVYKGYGYVAASVETPPGKTGAFFDAVARIAADLKSRDVSADELTRATLPRIEAIKKAQQSNEFWLDGLAGGQDDPRRFDALLSQIPQLEQVTPADVRRVAQTYLVAAKTWTLQVLPEGKP